ncbi:MAG TPA: DUF6498-containing protein [Casimicrobiaceae bacterium]|nr:DUF6498-containing protein [Casimicrobiaceae bacterium]
METLRTPAAAASLIAANLAPLAGILLLGWSPSALLVLYFVDTFLALGGVVLLVALHVTGTEDGRRVTRWRDWLKACLGLAVMGAIMALPLAIPLFFVIDEVELARIASDRELAYALLWQVLASMLFVVRQHRELLRTHDDDRRLAGRLFFLVARWIVMFVAALTGFLSILGPTIASFAMVAIYAGASIYFELFPDRAVRLIRGKDAQPLTFEGDLDSRKAVGNNAAKSSIE